MAFITINGQEFPEPDNVWELITYTNVTAGRNAQGEFIGDRVGRDQYKVNNLQWSWLPADVWANMCRAFSAFVVTARIWDPADNDWVSIQMYPGDRSATGGTNDEYSRPLIYRLCKVNIIDCGVID